MHKEFWKHKLAYGVLLAGITAFIYSFFAVWPDRVKQRLISGVFVSFYFLWGVVTHVKTSRLTMKAVLEYLVASLLVGTLLFLVTLE
ncbi:MAG: hypothetical protein UY13_C0002G0240 [Candidatus Pacebacteria bacterium GW2011_GWB1_47_8]|nr:MAG: hypothetical protein UX28_C0001G0388 [Candidatus Pacebacteria bacterium GW2011_GWA1_46_10]KKU84328.1 MAG: hypothetical protein UY13_C0002G0240 [Candidatus Pacebacteria bacterium GW2011_GWB1_47_8]HCR81247.1 hypothetical protein [Candidatus Paceibacterota bacterium]